MKTSSSHVRADNSDQDLQGRIETELSDAGLMRATAVGQRLRADMDRELRDVSSEHESAGAKVAPTADDRQEMALPPYSSVQLPREDTQTACAILNQSLADCINLQLQSQQAKWEASADGSNRLSDLFEEIGRTMCEHQEQAAVRILALGGTARGTLMHVCERSGLAGDSSADMPAATQIDTISSALDVMCVPLDGDIEVLAEIGDASSADILTALWYTCALYRDSLGKQSSV